LASWTTRTAHAAAATVFHEFLDLFDLIGREHAPRRQHRVHTLLRHLSTQVRDLLDFPHDGVLIGVVGPHQFFELDAAQLEIGSRPDASLLRFHIDFMQARNLRGRQIQSGTHTRIVRHTQNSPATAESATSSESAAPVLSHHAMAPKASATALESSAPPFATEAVLSRSTGFVLPLHPGRMLPLPSILAVRLLILAPRHHRCSHYHKKYRRDPSNSLSHCRFSSCPHLNHTIISRELLRRKSQEKHI
jgi:hypothetical protein